MRKPEEKHAANEPGWKGLVVESAVPKRHQTPTRLLLMEKLIGGPLLYPYAKSALASGKSALLLYSLSSRRFSYLPQSQVDFYHWKV